ERLVLPSEQPEIPRVLQDLDRGRSDSRECRCPCLRERGSSAPRPRQRNAYRDEVIIANIGVEVVVVAEHPGANGLHAPAGYARAPVTAPDRSPLPRLAASCPQRR